MKEVFKLSKEHIKIAKMLASYKDKNKNEKTENYLILESSVQKKIFEANITSTAKLTLIYLLSRIDYSYTHLFIYLPYSLLEKEAGIKKSTGINAMKLLDKEGFIHLLSGKERAKNIKIKEYLFKGKQFYNLMRNQQNIIDISPFFDALFKAQK